MTAHPQQSPRVLQLLTEMEGDRKAMLKLGVAMTGGNNAQMLPFDFITFGAVKRNLSLTAAMRLLVESWNIVCARAVLRLHIDTSLRYSAAWMVDKPHDFATKILSGERIDLMKDKNGKRLTDARLVEVRSADYPWLPDVYANLSGYVHFSGSHVFDSIGPMNEETRSVSFEITDTDMKFPEASWIEILECFRHATEILANYLECYITTKQLSTEQL
ncbi:hypothetical protein [Janthinobacterium sp. B9-8]|uniref:hypothetical protein n=1 Tax=Janthinobacterium sp. B9-8 TaxID=1236179 RepID=UPI00069C362D|nr:hypothetical protein [Janthinobacterium sp. B9-8]AMC34510.1 hypothetical protein VN23_07790 [Janthinobacterium sp. B9-8]